MRQRQFRKAVDRRADKLMEEYRKKAEYLDRLIGEQGQGRVRRRLDQFGDLVGIVVGQFNEVSGDIHMMLEQMADSRVAVVGHVNNLMVIVPADERDELLGELQDRPQPADAGLQQDADNDAFLIKMKGPRLIKIKVFKEFNI